MRMMNTLLCAPNALGAIAMEVLTEEHQLFFSACDMSDALSHASTTYPSVILVGGASTQAVVSSCRELRASPTCHHAVIVGVSKRPDDALALVDAGVDDFVSESVSKQLLRERLSLARHTADRRSAERDLAAATAHADVSADRIASVGTLAAGLAHEINNPLSYVTANVDMAIEEVHALRGGSSLAQIEEVETMLREARDGATRVMNIIRDLDTHARTSILERDSTIDLVDVSEVGIRRAFSQIHHRAHVVRDYGKMPLVNADDGRLGRVFNNLLVNACQAFATEDAIKNEIHIGTSTDTRGRAVVAIRDNGCGIPPEFLTRVFDPFFTTKPLGVGTGLGLAASRNIIVALGGEIAVESKAGAGTTVRVTLPASSVIDVARPTVQPTDPGRPAAVLVVDDERAIGAAIRRLLHDHDVTAVTSARAALDLLESGKCFDLVLCDLMMPGMSGMDLYGALLLRHPAFAPKVVFLTGGAFTPEADAFLRRVGNRRLSKPFDSDELRGLARLHEPRRAS
jgi:signal transduction histidine kinase